MRLYMERFNLDDVGWIKLMRPAHLKDQADASEYLEFKIDLKEQQQVSAYDELPLWSALFGQLLLKNLPLRLNMKVLDVGCGTGFPTIEVAQRLGPTCTVVGIDIWEEALRRAEQKVRVYKLRNVILKKCDASSQPFSDEEFDLILSNLGVNNFINAATVMDECWRVLKPAGKLILTTNLQGHMQEFYQLFESTLREMGEEQAVQELGAHIASRATTDSIERQFTNAGFKLSRREQDQTTMRFVDGSSLLRHHFIKLAFLDGWKSTLEHTTATAKEIFSCLETNLNQRAAEVGLLELTIPMAYFEATKTVRMTSGRSTPSGAAQT